MNELRWVEVESIFNYKLVIFALKFDSIYFYQPEFHVKIFHALRYGFLIFNGIQLINLKQNCSSLHIHTKITNFFIPYIVWCYHKWNEISQILQMHRQYCIQKMQINMELCKLVQRSHKFAWNETFEKNVHDYNGKLTALYGKMRAKLDLIT